MLVRPTRLLIVVILRVKRESEALAALLVVRRRLGHLLFEINNRAVIVLLKARRGRCARLYDDWVHILNFGYLDLLFAVFPGRATPAYRLWWV